MGEIQFEKKRMFFGQVGGSKPAPKDRELQNSGYYTTAPASLPCAPKRCEHSRRAQRSEIPSRRASIVECLDCHEQFEISDAELRFTERSIF